MKIDFVIGRLKAGGAERVVSILADYFCRKGYSVRIITFMDGDDYTLDPRIERLRFHEKSILNWAAFRGFIRLMRFYRRKGHRPDVVCSHIDMIGYATILPCKLYGIPLTVSEHFNHINQPKTLPRLFLWNFLYRLPEAVTVLTQLDVPYFQKRTKQVEVMPNPSSFTSPSDIFTERKKRILAVGNLDRYHHKGFDNLIAIAGKVLPPRPDWKLSIVGGGSEGMEFLKTEAQKAGLGKQIEFLGYRNDVATLMYQSEIFVLSSRHEGLPMVLIEALSQGMACIAYDCISGPSDILEDGANGLLIKDQDHQRMAEQLAELMTDGALRKKLRTNSVRSIQKFSLETVGAKWERLLEQITA